MSACVVQKIHNSSQSAILTSAACNLTIIDGTYDGIINSGTASLSGNLNLEYISSGTVNIASGASIALTKNIKAAINVDGVCYVNGATVSAGVYTNIDSAGSATT
jgi:hypothetical protein